MMSRQEFEQEILSRVKSLNGSQKNEVLNYLEKFPNRHSTKLYRRKAMKQIRQALQDQ